MRHIQAITILTLIFHTAAAQEPWSLEKCIEYALEHNITVRQQSLNVAGSDNLLKKSKLSFFPDLDISLGHSLNWGRSVDLQNLEIIHNRLSQSTSIAASSSIYLIDGLSRLYGLISSRQGLEAAEEEAERIKDDITLSVIKSYMQVLLAQEELNAAMKHLESISAQRERTVILVEEGTLAYTSLLETEAQLAAERVDAVNAENRLEIDMLNLKQLLGLPAGAGLAIAFPETGAQPTSHALYDVDEIYSRAQSLPFIQSARMAIDKSLTDLKSAKGQYWPKLSLSASYGTFYSSSTYAPDGSVYPFFSQFRDNINPAVSIGLSIPLFNNGETKAAVREAELEHERCILELEARQQTLYKDIQTAVTEVRNCRRRIDAALANLSLATESFNCARERFDTGTIDGTDYTTARNSMIEAESEYIRAKYQYLFIVRVLDFHNHGAMTP
ncbi:MAG TPA: TolC family protein [Candidatus Coprenecus stercoravium]|uniref:TolC family protein n=1 Tax=Candidatus Coprenecus stercoravium TaxID=2840735 RepID=A0A9D2GQN3_9BACT|nr:TolC family protein [Candidatus Coprenecus stercoravium]